MNHPEFKDLCSEYERRIRASGQDINAVNDFAAHCQSMPCGEQAPKDQNQTNL
tara:strand:+ start:7224 stop:7382 length:159 start_codon:yes stop_codon:yes gene_type:complete